MASSELTPRQQRFVDEYLVDLNATQAAIRAGYAASSAYVSGPRDLLGNPRVRAAIDERRQELAMRIGVTHERVLTEYARIAFADMRRFAKVGKTGVELKSSEEWTDEDAAVVSEVSETVNGGLRFKLHSKVQALDSLARHLGLFETPLEAGETVERLVVERRTRSLGS